MSPVQKDICRKRTAALRTALIHAGTSDPHLLFHFSLNRLCKAEKLSMIPGRAMKVYVENLIPFELKWGQWLVSILCRLTPFGHSSGIPHAKSKSVPVSRKVKSRPKMSAWKSFLVLKCSVRLQFFSSFHNAPIGVSVRREHTTNCCFVLIRGTYIFIKLPPRGQLTSF